MPTLTKIDSTTNTNNKVTEDEAFIQPITQPPTDIIHNMKETSKSNDHIDHKYIPDNTTNSSGPLVDYDGSSSESEGPPP